MKRLTFTTKPIDRIETTLAIVPVFEDVRPLKGASGLVDWRLNGALSALIQENKFTGEFGESMLMPARHRLCAKQIVLLGMGPQEGFGEYLLPALYRRLLELVFRKRDNAFCFCLSDLIVETFEWRNSVRKLVSKLFDYDNDFHVVLTEKESLIREARKRNMDFGLPLETRYDL